MCTRPPCPAETLGGLTVRAPQLTEPGPELGRRKAVAGGPLCLGPQPVTLTHVPAGPSCEATEEGKKCSRNRTDSVSHSAKLHLPPAVPITGWVWTFPNHRPDCRPSVLHAGHGRCAVWWEGRGSLFPNHCPLSLCSCPGGPAWKGRRPRRCCEPRGGWR